jgi:hypothetical protein
MKLGNALLLLANIALFLVLGWLILCQGLPLRPSAGWEYKDLIAALLTVVTIAMAFIGLAVGLAAIWGWQTISQGAARKAAEQALSQNSEHLTSDAFREQVKVLLQEHIENMTKESVQDAVVVEQRQEQPRDVQPSADEEWQD